MCANDWKEAVMLPTSTDTDLETLIRQRDFATLRARLADESPPDIAAALDSLTVEDQVLTFRVLPRDLAADVFEYLPFEQQEQLLHAMAREDVAGILNEMAPDDRTALLDELPATITQQLLNLLSPRERAVATQLLGYPEGSVGRLMTPEYVRVRPEWTIAYALDHIRRYGRDSETLNHFFVIDERGQLIDDIRIRTILLAAPTMCVLPLAGGVPASTNAWLRVPGIPCSGPIVIFLCR
jgi:magnesium transporter